MRKLVESTFMTLDGVVNDPQNWSQPYWDEEHAAYSSGLLFAADALLLGRKTYESFAEAWSARPSNEFTDRINALPKYVASRTLEDPTWNATVLAGDVPEAVAALKAEDGGTLLKYGTGELSKTLLEHRLVDEYHLWIFPVLAGGGDRLFEGVEATFELEDTTRFASGIVVLRYGPK